MMVPMATNEKPSGAKAGWKLRQSEIGFENKMFRIRDDDVELSGGKRMQFAYMDRAEAVIIVPVTTAGEMVLLKQYRYPVDEWCLEVPAGGTHDTGGASLEEVVRNELREEIGATAGSLTYVNFFYTANASSNEKCHVFLAEDVELSKEPKQEESEEIQMELVPLERAFELARTGAMKTAACALAVLLCEPRLRKA